MNEEKSFYVKDSDMAGFRLEPIKCIKCGKVGYIVLTPDFSTCEWCGQDQRDKRFKVNRGVYL